MNTERLLMLATALEKDADNPKGIKFDLGSWGSARGSDIAKVSCGTTACAVGLACLLPEFNDQGFHNGRRTWIQPTFKTPEGALTEWDAVTKFFDIGRVEARYLFLDDYYFAAELPTTGAEGELAVAKRIRELVAKHEQDGA